VLSGGMEKVISAIVREFLSVLLPYLHTVMNEWSHLCFLFFLFLETMCAQWRTQRYIYSHHTPPKSPCSLSSRGVLCCVLP